ncbi:MAG TPA: Ig-like domain-containing protein [Gemmatales bacterium]|nr:Ig-like domain-containing protein [Gemmatales bacterium]HMP59409.1 Ig-like domain-containing protein [Gemmatales bacterium]
MIGSRSRTCGWLGLAVIGVWLIGALWLEGAARTGPTVDEVTLENVPPVVVKTVPEAGAADVDPKLTEIKVTFSKEMTDKSWSWVIVAEENYPKTTDEPRFQPDEKTCVLPVKLEAGKTYALWLNRDPFTSFRDADGRSAVPYLLVFRTRR